jgi:hypothetical protein
MEHAQPIEEQPAIAAEPLLVAARR